ncbi:permease for cytosine/purines, uracil, thiamine, allantoin [Pseudomonas mandelii JR-1]|uniref:Permease for cytosine/purines, uracil, thiamine, allantoin n=1 Tax=Pseudomonas mandelii JR-1 TaxID=1147786 RepID=A0A024E4Q4_9PSED|nr:permease for cytosine/purines, uracil, thiamine, allantoin [Pseudomonas mandelii JR-1]
MFFDERGGGCCGGNHDGLQGNLSTWTYFGERRTGATLFLLE